MNLSDTRADWPHSAATLSDAVAAVACHAPHYVNQLILAADRRDWSSMAVLSETLADGAAAAGDFQLTGAARQLVSAAESRAAESQIKRCLLRVMGAAGKSRRQAPAR